MSRQARPSFDVSVAEALFFPIHSEADTGNRLKPVRKAQASADRNIGGYYFASSLQNVKESGIVKVVVTPANLCIFAPLPLCVASFLASRLSEF